MSTTNGWTRLDARPQEPTFPMAGLQHVQADPQVRVEEAVPVERRFPGPLQPDEDHRLHDPAPSSESGRKVTTDPHRPGRTTTRTGPGPIGFGGGPVVHASGGEIDAEAAHGPPGGPGRMEAVFEEAGTIVTAPSVARRRSARHQGISPLSSRYFPVGGLSIVASFTAMAAPCSTDPGGGVGAHVGLDPAGADRVDRDPVPGEVLGEAPASGRSRPTSTSCRRGG